MTQKLPALKQKAGTIRAYLQRDDVKKQVQMALPKHLSADRLLRVAYTSITKNPKLLDCTTESLLSAIIHCAQLGLEPILGRAYLIPYGDVAQFQPGYQGLVDLIRRTNDVSDVWAEVIYEADTYKITYGLHRDLIHEPNYKAVDRGKPVGTYAVIKYKDGTLGWTYMHIHDVYRKHRDRSQAYQAAIKYNKEDTPWITDEEDMIKKTVLKKHSKLAPMSIEFQTAAAVDDAVEIGADPDETWAGFLAAKGREIEAIDVETGEVTTTGPGIADEFAQKAKELADTSRLDQFIKECAEYGSVEPDKVREMAVAKWSEFAADYSAWLEKQEPPPPPPPEEFICQVEGCGFKAKSERGLKKHQSQQHKEPEEPTTEPPPVEPPVTEPGTDVTAPGDGEEPKDFFSNFESKCMDFQKRLQDAMGFDQGNEEFFKILSQHEVPNVFAVTESGDRQKAIEITNALADTLQAL